MTDISELKKERVYIIHDMMNNIIPKRVPINITLGMRVYAEYANIDPKLAYWDYPILEETIDEFCKMVPSDVALPTGNFFHPAKYQALDSKAIVMSADGYMQHPNVNMLQAEEYDEFILDPYKSIVETAVPRVSEALDFKKNPVGANAALHKAIEFDKAINAKNKAMFARISEKFAYAGFPRGGGGYPPFDIITDELRGFSNILTDIRRYKSKVRDAVEAVSPFNFFHSMPNMNTYERTGYNFYAFHMATYMGRKDFEDLWWRPFMREANDFASMGVRVGCFLETDWTSYIDYLQDLPTGSYLQLEYGDVAQFKGRLGKHCILTGGFPLGTLTQFSKEECIDKTREFLDIMMPGGQFSFQFDKGIIALSDINLENLIAVGETVRKYGEYDNAGESCGEIFNKEDYTKSDLPEFKSEAYMSWDDYISKYPDTPNEAKSVVESIEKDILNVYYSLIM